MSMISGVTVTVDPDEEKGKFWSIDDIRTLEDKFWRDASTTIRRNKYIVAEMIFKTDPYMDTYKRGQKLYTFNFRRQTDKMTEKEGRWGFSCCFIGSFFATQSAFE